MGSKAPLKKLLAESLEYSETVTPYIAKIDPATMAVTTLNLTQKHGVNYIGGLLIDSNGYIYAVARAVLYKIDPQTFSIVASVRLPLAPDTISHAPNKLTAYNGMQATLNGDLILKGFQRLFRKQPGRHRSRRPERSLDPSKNRFDGGSGRLRMLIADTGGREYVPSPPAPPIPSAFLSVRTRSRWTTPSAGSICTPERAVRKGRRKSTWVRA